MPYVTNRRTGKKVFVEWDRPYDPSPEEMQGLLDKQESKPIEDNIYNNAYNPKEIPEIENDDFPKAMGYGSILNSIKDMEVPAPIKRLFQPVIPENIRKGVSDTLLPEDEPDTFLGKLRDIPGKALVNVGTAGLSQGLEGLEELGILDQGYSRGFGRGVIEETLGVPEPIDLLSAGLAPAAKAVGIPSRAANLLGRGADLTELGYGAKQSLNPEERLEGVARLGFGSLGFAPKPNPPTPEIQGPQHRDLDLEAVDNLIQQRSEGNRSPLPRETRYTETYPPQRKRTSEELDEDLQDIDYMTERKFPSKSIDEIVAEMFKPLDSSPLSLDRPRELRLSPREVQPEFPTLELPQSFDSPSIDSTQLEDLGQPTKAPQQLEEELSQLDNLMEERFPSRPVRDPVSGRMMDRESYPSYVENLPPIERRSVKAADEISKNVKVGTIPKPRLRLSTGDIAEISGPDADLFSATVGNDIKLGDLPQNINQRGSTKNIIKDKIAESGGTDIKFKGSEVSWVDGSGVLRSASIESKFGPRTLGTNPRNQGTAPRQTGLNTRNLGLNPRSPLLQELEDVNNLTPKQMRKILSERGSTSMTPKHQRIVDQLRDAELKEQGITSLSEEQLLDLEDNLPSERIGDDNLYDDYHERTRNKPAKYLRETVAEIERLEKQLGERGSTGLTPAQKRIKARIEELRSGISKSQKEPSLLRKASEEVFGLPKALMASFDISAPGRQGLLLSLGRPKEAAKAFKNQMRVLFSEKTFQKVNQEMITKKKNWYRGGGKNNSLDPYSEVGLELTQVGTEGPYKPKLREEIYQSKLAEKIPGIKQSERGYVTYLNHLRSSVYDSIADKWTKQGITMDKNLDKYKALAEYVNTMSGRANLGKYGERISPVLNKIFFSPRFQLSRAKILNPATYVKMPKELRLEAMRDILSSVGIISSGLFLAKASGLEVETNPTATDFGKIKLGDTRFDITGGMAGWIRFFSRISSGRFTSSTGNTKRYSKHPMNDVLNDKLEDFSIRGAKQTVGKEIQDFTEYKLSPTFGLGLELARGHGPGGFNKREMVNENVRIPFTDKKTGEKGPGSSITSRLSPLILQDLDEMTRKYGWKMGAALMLPALVGIGVQDYNPRSVPPSNSQGQRP